jgi:hypothetical protein
MEAGFSLDKFISGYTNSCNGYRVAVVERPVFGDSRLLSQVGSLSSEGGPLYAYRETTS